MAQKGFGGGIDRLSRKLKAIPKKAQAAAVRAVTEGAYEIAELQYKLAPVDDGDLRNSIEVTPPGHTTPPYSQPGGGRMAGPTEAIITAGDTKVRYANLVEYGTAPHINAGEFAGTLNPGAKAQPFFFPGYRALRKRAKTRIASAINKAVKDGANG